VGKKVGKKKEEGPKRSKTQPIILSTNKEYYRTGEVSGGMAPSWEEGELKSFSESQKGEGSWFLLPSCRG